MKRTKHDFAWESDQSHEVFWQYQSHLQETAQREVPQIMALCSLPEGQGAVLDVGCGQGFHCIQESLAPYY